MHFKRLYVKNFLAIGEKPFEVLFPNTNGLTLIRGINLDVGDMSSNASGKSTFVEALLFAFFGKTLRKIKKDEHYINYGKKGCHVELEFDNVKIVRKITKAGKSTSSSVEFYIDGERQSTDASVTKVKEDIEKKLNVNFETMCNILIFGQHNIISFLDAGEPEKREIVENLMNLKEYNLFEEKAKTLVRETKTKIKILTETHNVQLSHLGEQIVFKSQQEKLRHEYWSKLDSEIHSLQIKIDEVPNVEFIKGEWERYNNAIESKQSLERQINSITEQKNKILEQLAEALKEKEQEAQKRKPIELELENAKRIETNILERRRSLLKELDEGPENKELTIVKGNISLLDAQKKQKLSEVMLSENFDALLSTASKEIKTAQIELDNFRNKKPHAEGEICSECFGQIDINNHKNYEKVLANKSLVLETKKSTHQDILNRKLTDQARMSKSIEDIEGDFHQQLITLNQQQFGLKKTILAKSTEIENNYRSAMSKVADMISSISIKLTNFDKILNAEFADAISIGEKTRDGLQLKLGSLNRDFYLVVNVVRPTVTLEEVARQQTNAENFKKTLIEKKAQRIENPYEQIIASLTVNIDIIGDKIRSSEKQIKEAEKILPYYEFWVESLGKTGLKSFVIDQIIPTLNEQIQYWMQIIYQGAITIKFDKFLNVTMINNTSKNEMIFGQGSGGERRRVDIAVMLAFRQIMKLTSGHDPDILFLDEVSENVDIPGLHMLYSVMENIAKTSRVYVITHHPVLLGLMANNDTMTVQKENGEMVIV